MLTQAPKGTRDILPQEMYKWQYVEKIIKEICDNFGYSEIRIPVFEHTELFQRGVGDTTDIVQKEMYTFEDKGGRSITLRPEGTAGVVRSYIQNGMASLPQPVKLFYNITAYRYENVQKGRYREFNQFGAEAFGAEGPSIDVEIISIADLLFKKLGISNIRLNINSIGCPECREKYGIVLKEYLEQKKEQLCSDCRVRLDRNPLRVLDCKVKECNLATEGAPSMLENLCEECGDHFEGLKRMLEKVGIDYAIDSRIVRGLDYYTKTVFEFVSENVGTQGTICGGGRYDGLVEACGGSVTPAVGFALGMERLIMEMDNQNAYFPLPKGPELFVASIGSDADLFAQELVYQLRENGISAEKNHMGRSLKAQMKYADKCDAAFTVVIGENEILSNKAVLKNMETGEEKDVSLDSIPERFKRAKSACKEGTA